MVSGGQNWQRGQGWRERGRGKEREREREREGEGKAVIATSSSHSLLCSIFGHQGSAADDILYVNWLNMVRAGVMGLEFYTPETKKWRQVRLIHVGKGGGVMGGASQMMPQL